ncbi:unnamed protein product [Heterobilharzia americana]|nr:unnamed protein product [Heterobilharzia americana]
MLLRVFPGQVAPLQVSKEVVIPFRRQIAGKNRSHFRSAKRKACIQKNAFLYERSSHRRGRPWGRERWQHSFTYHINWVFKTVDKLRHTCVHNLQISLFAGIAYCSLPTYLINMSLEECFYKYTKHGEFLDGPCFKTVFSKLLGYGIIIGSSLVKIPQVLKVAKCKNAYGLSILSILLELISFTSMSVYSIANKFPFSSYGEGIFLGIQDFLLAIMAITWTYSRAKAVLFTCTYMAGLAVLLSPTLPLSTLMLLQTANLPIMLSSKIAQIWTNWCSGTTGQLSAITVVLFAVGSTARIFTSIQETGDRLMIVSCILAALCNYLLLVQLVYYWNVPGVSVNDAKNKPPPRRLSPRKMKAN